MRTIAFLAVLAVSFPASAQEPQALQGNEHQAISSVRVLAEGAPMPEGRPNRINPFYRQDLITEGGIVFDIPAAEIAALRARYDLEESDPFVLTEWLARPPGATSRHLGYLHCASRIRTFRGLFATCLRDSNADSRLDQVVVFDRLRFPSDGLRFQPIEPIPYHYQQAARTPFRVRWGSRYVGPGLGIAWNFDRDRTRLLLYAQALNVRLRADIDPPVEVDPAGLPATIEIAGAQVTILAWDGRRPTLRVDRSMTGWPIRLISPDDWIRIMIGGSRRGWGLEISDVPLPGAPPAEAATPGRG